MKHRQEVKISISVVLLFTALTYLLINHFAPTHYFRDVFFYADAFVAHNILIEGHIQPPSTIQYSGQWGKIGTELRLPMLPLTLVIINRVTSLPIETIHGQFPTVLVFASGLYIIMRRLRIEPFVATLFAISGGIAVPTTSYYPISASAAAQGLMILGIAVVAIHLSVTQKRRRSTFIIITIFLVFLLYRYPTYLAVLAVVTVLAGIGYAFRHSSSAMTLSIGSLSAFLGLQIFEIPLRAYVLNIRSLLVLIIAGGTQHGGSTAGSSEGFSLSLSQYPSLLPLFVLFPLGVAGGLLILRDIQNRDAVVSLTMVAWAVAAVVISVIYLFSPTPFLGGRSFFFALPVVIVAASRALRSNRQTIQIATSSVVIILVLTSLIMQLSTAGVALQTYEPGIDSGVEWVGAHTSKQIISDFKLGAPLAAKGIFRATYPIRQDQIHALVHPANYSEFASLSDGPIILSPGMKTYGTRLKNAGGPTTDREYTMMTQCSQKTFSNGAVDLVYRTRGICR